MSSRTQLARMAWRAIVAVALVLGSLSPLVVAPAGAQNELPATAAAAPASSIFFEAIDLDLEGEQWQQTDELLARIGIPNALETWRQEVLAEGAQAGDFTAADLDALLGGEIAVAVTPDAIKHAAAMHAMHQMHEKGQHHDEATSVSMAMPPDMALGASLIFAPGDPDVAWDYVQRQFQQHAAEMDHELKQLSYGDNVLLQIEHSGHHKHQQTHDEDAQGDRPDHQMPADFGLFAGRASEFIVVGMTKTDVTDIIDVVNGEQPSLADVTEAEDVAAALPTAPLAFGYFSGSAFVDGLDEQAMAELQSSMPDLDPASLRGHGGFAVSTSDIGFHLDSIAVPAAGVNLAPGETDFALVRAADNVPADSFLFQAGAVPEGSFAEAAYYLALAVNTVSSGETGLSDQIMDQIPSQEEIDRQIAMARMILGFDPRTGLFDLLGGHFLLFAMLPTMGPAGPDVEAAVAVESSDPDTLSQNVGTLINLVGRIQPGTITESHLNGSTMYSVSDPTSGTMLITFGVMGDALVVGTSSGVAHLASPGETLADDPLFRTIVAELPADFQEITYVNTGQAVDLVTMLVNALAQQLGMAPAAPAPAGGPGLDALRAFASVTYQREDAIGSSAILYVEG